MRHFQLFELIKSMSRSEKGYFKKYSSQNVIGGENNYITLFNAIEKQKEYNESAIKQKLKKERFIGHLAVLKKYLHKLILKSLRSYYEERTLDFQIRARLSEIHLLHERGLPEQAEKIVKKVKHVAIKNEKLILLQEINEWERKLIKNELYRGKTLDQISGIEKEQETLLMKLAWLNKLNGIKERTFFSDYNLDGEEKKLQIKKLSLELDKIYTQLSPAYNTFRSSMVYYRIRGKHASVLQTSNVPSTYSTEMLHLLESNPQAILNDPESYVITLFNLLAGYEHRISVKEQVAILNKIADFENKNKKLLSFKNRVLIFSYLSIIRTHLFNFTAEFEEAKNYIHLNLLKQFKEYETKMIVYDKIILSFNILAIYFGAEEYRTALRWSNKIINDAALSVADDIAGSTKLLNIIIHYELHNRQTISSLISSAERYFQSKTVVSQPVLQFLQVIKENVLSEKNKKAALKMFRHLKEVLEKDASLPQPDKYLKNFDFTAWIDSKIQNRTFAEVVREKSKMVVGS
ncbi:MAG: hypothetical protein IT235_03680 [Bacteroidia bacterium]|nr:hypothetical protein [Bacteroidia bacterium]